MKRTIFAVMAMCAIAACKGAPQEEHKEAEHHSTDEIVFDEARQQKFNIRTDTVKAEVFSQTVHVGGEILPAPDDCLVLAAPVSGTVTFTTADLNPGSRIAAGQTIVRITSIDGDRVVMLKAEYDAARAEYERDSAMVGGNIVSTSHFDASRAEYLTARSRYEAVARTGSAVRSSCKGYIRSIDATAGEYVEAGCKIATLSKGRTLSLRADVPVRYAQDLPTFSDANFSTPDGRVLNVKALGGKVSACSHTATDGYFTITFSVPDNGTVTAGTFSEVWLRGAQRSGVIVLPRKAVIEEQGICSVFVQLDGDCFTKREVALGASDGVNVEIVEGLSEGECVVTDGAMHIKLASVSAVPSGHNHNH